ncbi:helix-turn-helix domain-containing protein [Corynebacterium sanguinis]|uniref:Helix-turn-helix transcriptional regulator n=1 Tax=Corynebacterium sanguinis TaxID=2594913 RepID=A0A6C1TZ68_9CORY|nr:MULTISPECIES: helix-turn-helix transcriptional regulator [Corynebacterium]MBA4506024.1 helix-turn-helix transcriptional regulator [Corynebacterium sanguinis]MCT1410997.1 helix-turn-helix domain-containing protein [Corynebacterium sanguinis]MCT1414771.1 helix-turn-helix domain-containing protein [Corynebacterium sanguinis]MCT1424719.1 helix-turn-helix domain-containing protein [Corynebacterium sanguinis]MCT1444445.1 helix-turn-helix domain-containing protein [Corynebacterium sanguinis]
MATTTLLLDNFEVAQLKRPLERPVEREAVREPLLREALGMSLRAFRADKNVSLRTLAAKARVSSGYISELERGRKEVSSELLASICEALDTTVAEVLLEAVANLSLKSITDELEASAPAAAEI